MFFCSTAITWRLAACVAFVGGHWSPCSHDMEPMACPETVSWSGWRAAQNIPDTIVSSCIVLSCFVSFCIVLKKFRLGLGLGVHDSYEYFEGVAEVPECNLL